MVSRQAVILVGAVLLLLVVPPSLARKLVRVSGLPIVAGNLAVIIHGLLKPEAAQVPESRPIVVVVPSPAPAPVVAAAPVVTSPVAPVEAPAPSPPPPVQPSAPVAQTPTEPARQEIAAADDPYEGPSARSAVRGTPYDPYLDPEHSAVESVAPLRQIPGRGRYQARPGGYYSPHPYPTRERAPVWAQGGVDRYPYGRSLASDMRPGAARPSPPTGWRRDGYGARYDRSRRQGGYAPDYSQGGRGRRQGFDR